MHASCRTSKIPYNLNRPTNTLSVPILPTCRPLHRCNCITLRLLFYSLDLLCCHSCLTRTCLIPWNGVLLPTRHQSPNYILNRPASAISQNPLRIVISCVHNSRLLWRILAFAALGASCRSTTRVWGNLSSKLLTFFQARNCRSIALQSQ